MKSVYMVLYIAKIEIVYVKQVCRSTKAWIELWQRLFDIVSYIDMMNDYMKYKNCGLKDVEQVSSINGDEINNRKSENSPKQNCEANDSENCYKNEISDSKFGDKYEKTVKMRNMSVDRLN
ncbi:4525_t:CDS:2 [Racocetra fulgida]|uniref:4525_t:CDS:1 n=1 Tax=Racocetra fulgida TaxID=60492 RepID=A0A9N8W443_9GLOM|nr:4525_t:CDS:2 [Racocetra fulgida]